MVAILVLLLALAGNTLAQGGVGQRCKMSITGLPGLCTPGPDCASANKLALQGVNPTICSYDINGIPVVCCEGRSQPSEISFLNNPNTGNNNNPIFFEESNNNNERISEQKCSEYSRLVNDQLSILSLNADAVPTSINITKCDKDGIPLIVGGTPAALGEFPFMAAIGFNTGDEPLFGCGGTLISKRYVLTAAHCSFHRQYGAAEFVRLGDLDLESELDGARAIDVPISSFIKHPRYRANESYDDIALVRLKRTVQITKTIRPACLWSSHSIKNTKALATGWGQIGFGDDASPKLLKVGLNIFPLDRCKEKYTSNDRKLPRGVVSSMLCAGELKGGKDTCKGDSGGPLFITKDNNQCVYYTVGVTSFGKFCGLPDTPGIYTRVAAYIEWIENTIW